MDFLFQSLSLFTFLLYQIVEILKSEKGNKEWEHVGKTVIDIKIDSNAGK